MSSPSLAFQKAARARLIAVPDVLALVPATSIIDAIAVPERFPSILIGEASELPGDEVVGRYTMIHATMHIWSKGGLASAKAIGGALREALQLQSWTVDGFRCIDQRFESARYLRDPDGESTHGVVVIRSLVERL